MRKLLILTWVSASWKTFLQSKLIEKWLYQKPINFTTRPPRSFQAEYELNWDSIIAEDFTADEFNEYIFISQKNFLKKLKKWDFLETSTWFWDFYWVSNYGMPEWDLCVILDPIWRDQVLAKYSRWELDFEVFTVFLTVNKIVQKSRLKKRWDSVDQIRKREKDFKWIFPTPNCLIIDWTANVEESIKKIMNEF